MNVENYKFGKDLKITNLKKKKKKTIRKQLPNAPPVKFHFQCSVSFVNALRTPRTPPGI